MTPSPTTPKPVDFHDCLMVCAGDPKFIKEFNRLTGCSFGQSLTRKPIERMIDEACGRSGENNDDLLLFIAFVWEYVWVRFPGNHEENTNEEGVPK